MSFYELNPLTPDEEHPAIVEHHISVGRDGVPHDATQVFSQTGHEAERVDPADTFGIPQLKRRVFVAQKAGNILLGSY